MTDFELVKLCACFDFGGSNAVAKSTLTALASFYNEPSDSAWPSGADLQARASCQRVAMLKAVSWLETKGLITVERRAGKGNLYRFNIDLLKEGCFSETSSESITSIESVTGIESDIGTCIESDTTPVSNPIQGSIESDTQQKEYKKNTKRTYKKDIEPSAEKAKKERVALTHLFEFDVLPGDWKDYCEQTRPDLKPETVFASFKAYWTIGRGSGTRRSDKGWTQSWFNWVRNEREARNSGRVNGYTPQVTIGPKTLEPDWSQIDYGEGGFL